MKKVCYFLDSLKPSFYDVLGYPTIKVSSNVIEVYFDCRTTIADLSLFPRDLYDDFRMVPGKDCITVVFTFYILPFSEC